MTSESLHPLRPHETVQRILISSTSHFIGEFENLAILISHAFPGFQDRGGFARRMEGPSSRTGLIISFRTEPLKKEAGIVLPNFEPHGDLFCSYLSLLFGKRFDTHGPFETNGNFWLPDMANFDQFINHLTPQNRHRPRADLPIPLNLSEIQRLEALLLDYSIDQKLRTTFQAACRFYLRALQSAENDVEVSYLHLITAGEILSNVTDIDNSELIDDDTKGLLSRIEAGMPDGAAVSRAVRGKLRQIKRRFVLTITHLIDDDFFDRREAAHEYQTFRKDTFKQRISAAYDIRSRYVHTGTAFGGWIAPRGNGSNDEVITGRPVVNDAEFANLLERTPTYVGLERVMRYALLKFAEKTGLIDLSNITSKPADNSCEADQDLVMPIEPIGDAKAP
ncbi:hypothetical protein [Methylorubrum sp. SB2]|uniref:hypothetical protein n=1 Tax=Methylorubrum subtropicum TaxID=3138812 RepID=UPI00313E7A82